MTQPELFDLGPPMPPVKRIAAAKFPTPALPGSGPEGQTCGTCRHKVSTGNGERRYLKCALMRPSWTHGPGTDIRARWPACSHWETAESEEPA